MTTIGVHEAESRFSELLEQVEAGETIVVTRSGMPVARTVPVRLELADAEAAMEEIHQFRVERKRSQIGISIRELIDEGRE